MSRTTRNQPTAKQDVCTEIANRIAELLERGVAPWRRPWSAGTALPVNALTSKPYRGINTLALFTVQVERGYTDSRWVTYKQAQAMGGQVRKGEKGTRLVLWKPTQRRERSEDGEQSTRRSVVMRSFTVFNVEQCDGLELVARTEAKISPDVAAEEIVAGYLASGPGLHFGGDAAYYQPSEDRVTMPPIAAFSDSAEYYSTLFHELGHSTGHTSRLDRDLAGLRGDHSYSKEELVAEFTAAFLCGLAGVDNDASIENSAAYLKGWASKLRDEPKVLLWAASRAQKAVDLIINTEAQAIAA